MPLKFVLFENVSFRYESMPERLLQDFSAGFPSGWTGIAGSNGSGKTTLLKLACRMLQPSEGSIQHPGSSIYCAQRTDRVPDQFVLLLETNDRLASEIKGKLDIGGDWAGRWDTLSHGERKRAQIATALWQQPDTLALDEPTNHLDAEGRALLIHALRSYSGIGLLVSHDRELLDSLCERCLFLNPPSAVLRPGNYSSGKREELREESSLRRRKEQAKQEVSRLKAETQRRSLKAQENRHRYSKRKLDLRDHDGRGRIDGARLLGVDGHACKMAKRMHTRADRASQVVESIKVRKQYGLGIWIEGETCKRESLFRLPAGEVRLGETRTLQHPDLIMRPADRIALTGVNGSGKSMLIRRILSAHDLPPERLVYLPQEIDTQASVRILNEVRRQSPQILGRIMTVISRLGSRPAALLESAEPSPGELRKLLLGIGIARQPYLIIMDEPTNHLDLPSIECLEEALIDCPCGLLLVSHDQRLLERLTDLRWQIRNTQSGSALEIQI